MLSNIQDDLSNHTELPGQHFTYPQAEDGRKPVGCKIASTTTSLNNDTQVKPQAPELPVAGLAPQNLALNWSGMAIAYPRRLMPEARASELVTADTAVVD